MENEQIQATSDEPIRHHKLFRGIMLGFLFSIIIIGGISIATAQSIEGGFIQDRSQKVAEVKEALEIDEDVVLPTDGIQYTFKIIGERVSEIFTFDKSDKEELNVKIIDERAKEIAILDAQGDEIPDNIVKDYSDRIDRAERFVTLQTTDNENIDTRTVVRTALDEHKVRFLDRIQQLQDQPSESTLSRVVADFGDRIDNIIMRIDSDEVAIVKNTIPIIKQKQANIKLAEMVGDVERIKQEMGELEEIDDKLNRLSIAGLCNAPIRTLSLTTFEDIERICPVAALMEEDIRRELDKPIVITATTDRDLQN